MRAAIVSNASSGRGRAAHACGLVRAALSRAGIDAVDVSLDGPWDGTGDGLRAVIAVGGDGTVRAVAARLAGGGVPLAVVPAGTENLAARAFGFRIGADRLAAAVRAGIVRHVDLGTIRRPGLPDHRFVVMASAGFDADVVAALHGARRGPISHASYLAPIGATAWRWRAPEVTLSAAGGAPPSCWRGGVVVANAPEYAMRLNPARRADPADGLLDAVALRCRSAVGVVGWLARLAAFAPGASADRGRASAWRLRWDRPVWLQADGDPVPGGPVVEAEVEAAPGALALVDVRPAR